MKYLSKILLILIAVLNSSCSFYLPGFDFKLFKNTPAKELADAVEDEDLEEIEEIVKENKSIIEYKEPKFGNTVLMLAVANNKNKAVRKLLELGANPNERSPRDNQIALIVAVEYTDSCNTEVVRDLIKFGADVSAEQDFLGDNGTRRIRRTALTMAAWENTCLDVVKLLVENGADIDKYYDEDGYTALWTALTSDNLGIARYLMIERKAKIPKYIYQFDKGTKKEREVSAAKWISNPKRQTPENNRYRKEILEYLKAKGLE